NKLLTVDEWKVFQNMFEESRFEVYEIELTEREYNRYCHVKETGDIER
ncbi:15048_t:CDS:2, partial [Gigaspora margarita]